jgi:hypothetical protein
MEGNSMDEPKEAEVKSRVLPTAGVLNLNFGFGGIMTSLVTAGKGGPLTGMLLSTMEQRLELGGTVPIEAVDDSTPKVFLWFHDPKAIDVMIHQLAHLRLHYGKLAARMCGANLMASAGGERSLEFQDELALAVPEGDMPPPSVDLG